MFFYLLGPGPEIINTYQAQEHKYFRAQKYKYLRAQKYKYLRAQKYKYFRSEILLFRLVTMRSGWAQCV